MKTKTVTRQGWFWPAGEDWTDDSDWTDIKPDEDSSNWVQATVTYEAPEPESKLKPAKKDK